MSIEEQYEDQQQGARVDERVTLMQKISDMEHAHANVQREAEKLSEKGAKLAALINEARSELASRMGWDNSRPVRAMTREEAAKAMADDIEFHARFR